MVERVQLGVTAIKTLLENGYTWLKQDDLGFGSIQEKYQATDVQIATIRKHPLLKDLDTVARIFVIVDDTKETTEPAKSSQPVEQLPVTEKHAPVVTDFPVEEAHSTAPVTTTEVAGFEAFEQL